MEFTAVQYRVTTAKTRSFNVYKETQLHTSTITIFEHINRKFCVLENSEHFSAKLNRKK